MATACTARLRTKGLVCSETLRNFIEAEVLAEPAQYKRIPPIELGWGVLGGKDDAETIWNDHR